MKRIVCVMAMACVMVGGCRNVSGEVPEKKVITPGTVTTSGGEIQEGAKPSATVTPDESGWVKLETEETVGKIDLQGTAVKGISVKGEDYEFYGNLEENMRGGFAGGYEDEDQYRSLVCKDPVYQLTYFVNYGRDYYIYCDTGEEILPVVEIPATELYCRNGELYFIAQGYGKYDISEIGEGSILKYDPKTGDITVLVKNAATRMRVYKDEIAYELIGVLEEREDGFMQVKNKRFVYSFETGTAEQIQFSLHTIERLGSNYIAKVHSGEKEGCLKLLSGTERYLENSKKLPNHYWQKDDFFYFLSGVKIYRYSTQNGTYDLLAELPIYPENRINTEFVIWNDVVYFGSFYKIDLKAEDGKVDWIITELNKSETGITAFYTDGEHLYGVRRGKLWRIREEELPEDDVYYITDEIIEGKPLYSRYTWEYENPTEAE